MEIWNVSQLPYVTTYEIEGAIKLDDCFSASIGRLQHESVRLHPIIERNSLRFDAISPNLNKKKHLAAGTLEAKKKNAPRKLTRPAQLAKLTR